MTVPVPLGAANLLRRVTSPGFGIYPISVSGNYQLPDSVLADPAHSDVPLNRLIATGPTFRATSLEAVAWLRSWAIGQIFGSSGFPSQGATSMQEGVASPVGGTLASNLLRIDKLTFDMTNGQNSTVVYTTEFWVYRPTPETSNGRLALEAPGHGNSVDSTGYPLLLNSLLSAGYTVVLAYMFTGPHDNGSPTSTLNALRYFLEPYFRAINHLASGFSRVCMAGKSGGGWATNLVAALDPRIARSACIAGSMPLHVKVTANPNPGGGERDWEQFLPGLWPYVGYEDLYVMACDQSRIQAQIHNTLDSCCFNQAAYDSYSPYSTDVQSAAAAIGGLWTMHWIANPDHSILQATVNLVLAKFAA